MDLPTANLISVPQRSDSIMEHNATPDSQQETHHFSPGEIPPSTANFPSSSAMALPPSLRASVPVLQPSSLHITTTTSPVPCITPSTTSDPVEILELHRVQGTIYGAVVVRPQDLKSVPNFSFPYPVQNDANSAGDGTTTSFGANGSGLGADSSSFGDAFPAKLMQHLKTIEGPVPQNIDLVSLYRQVTSRGGYQALKDHHWNYLNQMFGTEVKEIYQKYLKTFESVDNTKVTSRKRKDPFSSSHFKRSNKHKLSKNITDPVHNITFQQGPVSAVSQFNFYLKRLVGVNHVVPPSFIVDVNAIINDDCMLVGDHSLPDIMQQYWQSNGPDTPIRLPYTCSDLGDKDIVERLGPWHLLNASSLPDSVLGVLPENDVSVLDPTIVVSRTFATDNWHCEDHFLQQLSRQMYGYRLWYIVPELEFEKMESLMTSTAPVVLNRLPQENPTFESLVQYKTRQTHQLSSARISPGDLDAKGIKYHTVLQKPGDFVIKYPKTYSLSISLGFSIAEEVNFASPLWLQYGLQGEKWLQQHHILPNFSFHRLLVCLVQSFDSGNSNRLSFSSEVYEQVCKLFDKFQASEMETRKRFRQQFGVKETTIDEKSTSLSQYTADDSFEVVYPSKIVIIDDNNHRFNVSLESFEQYMEINETEKDLALKTKTILPILSEDTSVEMHLFQSDEKLRQLSRILTGYSANYAQWVKDYETLMNENFSIPLRNYKALLAEGERIANNVNSSVTYDQLVGRKEPEALTIFKSQLQDLKSYIEYANNFVEECQSILSIKHQQRVRNSDEEQALNSPELILPQMIQLINKMTSLNFDCVELDQIIEFKNEIENFERSSRLLVSKENPSPKEFDELINLGKSFGINLKSLAFIMRIRDKFQWVKTFDIIVSGGDPFSDRKTIFTLSDLQDFYNRGEAILGSKDIDKLDTIQRMISNSIDISNNIDRFSHLEQINEASIKQVDELIDQIDEKFKLKNQDRIFINLSKYDELLDMRASLDALLKLYKFHNDISHGQTYSFEDANKIYLDMKATNLSITQQDWSLIEAPMNTMTEFLNSCLAAAKNVTLITTTTPASVKNSELKGAVNQELIKELLKLYGKCSISFAFTDDTYDNCSTNDVDLDPEIRQIYCVCREYEYGSMIECDKCKEWYHDSCLQTLGLGESLKEDKGKQNKKKDEQAEPDDDDDEPFVCPVCELILSSSNSDGHLSKQITQLELLKMVEHLKSLGVCPSLEQERLVDLLEIVQNASLYLFKRVYDVKSSTDTIDKKTDRLYFILRKVYGAGILIEDLLYELVSSIRKFEILKDIDKDSLSPVLGKLFVDSVLEDDLTDTGGSSFEEKIETGKAEPEALNGTNHDIDPSLASLADSENKHSPQENGAQGHEPTDDQTDSTINDQPVDTQPIDTQPIDTQPIDTQPIDTQPIDTQPIDTQPIDTQPIDTQPIDTQPIDTQPIDTQPIDTTPVDYKRHVDNGSYQELGSTNSDQTQQKNKAHTMNGKEEQSQPNNQSELYAFSQQDPVQQNQLETTGFEASKKSP